MDSRGDISVHVSVSHLVHNSALPLFHICWPLDFGRAVVIESQVTEQGTCPETSDYKFGGLI